METRFLHLLLAVWPGQGFRYITNYLEIKQTSYSKILEQSQHMVRIQTIVIIFILYENQK